MAKLTEEQKVLNKAAKKRRDAAYRARYAEYRAAKDAAEAEISASEMAARFHRSMEAVNAEIDAKRQAESVILDQIATLQAQLKVVEEAHTERIDAARKVRDIAAAKFFSAKREKDEEINAQFPDMCGFVSAAGWRPIDDFMEQP